MARPSRGPHLVRRSGVWYIAWADGSGRSPRASTGTRDRAEAEQALAGFIVASGAPAAAAPTIAVLLDRYLAARWPNGPPNAERYAQQRLAAELGALTPDGLTPEQVRRYVARRGARPTTAARELTVLRAALSHAVDDRIIASAPKIAVPPPAAPRDRWLTREEAAALVDACRLPHLRLFVLLALHTAARRGAILDLTWFQVDLERGRIDYNAPGRQQTAKRRPVVPINAPLLAALSAARAGARSPYVVEYRGEKLASVKKAFAAACRAAGLAGVIPHTLRHTAATWMAQAGVPLSTIAGILGQSIARTTERYIKHHPDYLRSGVDALAGAELARNPRAEGGKTVQCRVAISRKFKVVS